MLSFDEFRAVNQREKGKADMGRKVENTKASQAQSAPKATSSSASEDKKTTESTGPEKKESTSATKMLGSVLELQATQTLYIALLVLDTFAALAELGILSNQIPTKLFPLEIFLVYIAFGLATIRHFGYLMDFVVITTQLTLDYYGVGRVNRLLNLLRVWRPIRLLNAIVLEEREQREAVLKQVEVKDEELNTSKEQIESIKEELSKEKSARESIESMLQNYKEEVDTLNEALKIAAMDIAEVAQADEDLLTSDDDEHEHDEVTVSSTHSKTNKLRAAIGDNASVEGKTSTFVIYEDGGFEKK